jgi:lysine 2,3-aminomutase
MKVIPPFKVTPYLAKLIENEDCISKQFTPSEEEFEEAIDLIDPLEEEESLVLPKCVHKYADRVLIWATNICFANCRFCTRRRLIKKRESIISELEVGKIVDYLNKNPEVRDVIISGGDPLTLINSKLKYILAAVRKVESVQILRIGTRAPIVQPKRITSTLVNMIAKYAPVFVNIHINHPAELTEEVKEACVLMADAGLVLGAQTVLLKGINDNKEIMKELMLKLLTFRIRPYYIYLADRVTGTQHFWTSTEIGVGIINYLQETTSGLAIPQFVVDTKEKKVHLV